MGGSLLEVADGVKACSVADSVMVNEEERVVAIWVVAVVVVEVVVVLELVVAVDDTEMACVCELSEKV